MRLDFKLKKYTSDITETSEWKGQSSKGVETQEKAEKSADVKIQQKPRASNEAEGQRRG